MGDCVFCRIVAGTAPASVVDESDSVVAFMDTRPVNEGHLLVIPKAHAESLGEVPPGVAEEVMRVAQRLAAVLGPAGVPHDGFNLFLADGAAAGQEVFHAHLHVIPRRTGDGFRIEPTYGAPPTREQLDAIAARLRSAR